MAFQPRPAATTEAVAGAAPLRLAPLPLFDLRARADRWDLRPVPEGGHQWLPVVRKHVYRPGVQGAHFAPVLDGMGRPTGQERLVNRDDLQTTAKRQGWITVQRDTPAGDYLLEYDTPSGVGYCLAWESWEPAPAPFKPEHKLDHQKEVAFLRALVVHGIVPVPPEAYRTSLIREAQRKVDRIAGKASSARQAAELEAAEKELQLLQDTPLPKPEDYAPKVESDAKKGTK